MLAALPPIFITDHEALRTFADKLREVPRAAVDTESNSMHAYRERVCLIQISTPDGDTVIDPVALTDLSALASFFQNPYPEKVFHAAEYDLLCLRRDFGFRVRGLFDTHAAVRSLGSKECGLSPLLEAEFGVRLDKRMQRADWGKRPLPDRQLEYARYDTHYLLALRERLLERIDAAGLRQEVQDEFLRLEGIPDLPPEGETMDSFWRVRGVHDLIPAQRAVLRALFDWREEQAEKIDRPPFHVLSEENMTRIAISAPSSVAELAEGAGLPDRIIQRWGNAILQVVQRGRTGKPPIFIRKRGMDDHSQTRLEILRMWRKKRAQTRGVESDVILSRDSMFRIARAAPESLAELTDIPGLGTWRIATYGQEILLVLHPAQSQEQPCASIS